MMSSAAILLAAALTTAPTPPPLASPPTTAATADSLAREHRVPGLLARRWIAFDASLRISYPIAPPSGSVPASLGIGVRPPQRPLTPVERIVYGADRGAFAGLALGTLGDWTDLWTDDTAWALMGAGAALGAIWGGIGNDDVRITVRPGDTPRP